MPCITKNLNLGNVTGYFVFLNFFSPIFSTLQNRWKTWNFFAKNHFHFPTNNNFSRFFPKKFGNWYVRISSTSETVSLFCFLPQTPPTLPWSIPAAILFQTMRDISWKMLENMGKKLFPRNGMVLENVGKYWGKVVSKKWNGFGKCWKILEYWKILENYLFSNIFQYFPKPFHFLEITFAPIFSNTTFSDVMWLPNIALQTPRFTSPEFVTSRSIMIT